MKLVQRLCVFCGSNDGKKKSYARTAQTLGKMCADKNIELVFGGGQVGLMGEVSNACLNAGGVVHGVIPTRLFKEEVVHDNVTYLYEVETMHERKKKMYDLSDAFVALPGGLGTLEEIFEMLTWAQLQFHHKPCMIFNVSGYYNKLGEFLKHSRAEGFIYSKNAALIRFVEKVDEVFSFTEGMSIE